jgi:hypothetical protein
MTCPRCGQKLPHATISRCPSCGQPLYAPAKHPSPVTKLTPSGKLAPILEQSPPPPTPLDDDGAWPDLTVPRLREPGARRSDSPDTFRPLSRPSTWLLMPPSRERPRQLVGIIVAAALILIVISGGTLVLVNRLGHHSTASHSPTSNTALGSNATATGASSATATGTPATGVPTNTSGLPTATTVLQPPPVQPTIAPTAAAQLVTVFSDPLTSNTNGWPVQFGCSFAGGGYSVSAGARCQAPVTATDVENISVQVTGTTPTFQGAGIYFRIPGTVGWGLGYSFYISAGVCRATDTMSGNTLFNNTACTAVAAGQNAVNTMAINQSGAHMDFYVNGTLVGSANDATLSTGGIALYVRHGGATVIFTNFEITAVK